ncbi:MAG TPA: AraC family ligand binding domain-containing protein, partial [Chthonomonadaceae bacterium]|nr:AraC family ligand binding domain-containing protein [Chthonomonadaceae bacterium]
MTTPHFMDAEHSLPYRLNGLLFQEGGYSSDFAMPTHSHAEARLVLVLQGVVKHVCRKQDHLLTPSTLAFIPAEEPHSDHFREGVKAFIIGLEAPWLERYRSLSPFLRLPAEYKNSLPVWIATRLHRE